MGLGVVVKWLLAGTGCFCATTATCSYWLGPRLTFLLLAVTVLTVVIRGGSMVLDHAHLRARLELDARRPVTYRDTTSRPS